MTPKNFISSRLRPKLCAAALLALTAWRAQAQWAYPYDPDWTRSFRAGVLVGFNISANFSMKGSFGVSGGGAGIFDDGYVHPDDGGANTSDWGYNNASQRDSTHETLTLHRTTAFNTTSTAEVKDSAEIGLDLAYGGTLWRGERLRLGWELGFGLLPIKISDRSTLSATVKRSTYTFDTGPYVISGVDTFPSPGHQGRPNGGDKIFSTPNGPPTQDTFNNVQITGSRTLDVNFYALKLGPTIFWDINRYVGFSAGIGGAVGIVSGNLKYDETLNFAGGSSHNVGQSGNTELTYGGYVNAMVTFHTVKNGDFYVGAQYMPMGKVMIGGAGRQAELNLSGQIYVTAGINWPF